jgi:hypothetical protein
MAIDVSQFYLNGFIHIKRVIRENGIPVIKNAINDIITGEITNSKIKIINNKNVVERIEKLNAVPFFKTVIEYPFIKKIIQDIYNGLDVKFTSATYIHNKQNIPWSQEQFESVYPYCTLLMVIENSEHELRYVNSSHEGGKMAEFTDGILDKSQIDMYCSRYTSIVPEAGDIIISHPYIIHSLLKNGRKKISCIKICYG